jgi:NADH:ubiquinone oxidoreductase subunit K
MTVTAVYMTFAGLLCIIGLYCLLTSRNVIRLLIGIEIMVKAVVLSFGAAGFLRGNTAFAQSIIVTIIVIEVSLVAVALAIVINAHRNTGSLDIGKLTRLKG